MDIIDSIKQVAGRMYKVQSIPSISLMKISPKLSQMCSGSNLKARENLLMPVKQIYPMMPSIVNRSSYILKPLPPFL